MNKTRFLKTSAFIIVCLAVGLFLYSRRHTEYSWNIKTNSAAGQTDTSTEFPAHYEKEVSSLFRFDVEVDAPANAQPYQAATAKLLALDAEAITASLGKDSALPEPVIYDSYRIYDGTAAPITVYDNSTLYLAISDNDFSFDYPFVSYIYNSFIPYTSVEEYNANLYSTEDDLDFDNRADAWEKVKHSMKELGIDLSEAAPRITYALDAETLQQEESCIDVDGNEVPEERNPAWSKDQEGYYYYISQYYRELPVYAWTSLNGDSIIDVPLTIYQTVHGLSMITLSHWFEIQPGEAAAPFAEFEDIMRVLEERYSGTLQTNPLTVTSARLYAFPMATRERGVYSLEPVWVCTLEEYYADLGEDAYTILHYVPIHAITAEELPALEN